MVLLKNESGMTLLPPLAKVKIYYYYYIPTHENDKNKTPHRSFLFDKNIKLKKKKKSDRQAVW